MRVSARPTYRLALSAERSALEELQRRASLMWEEDREALLANPDAIELPLEQITDGRTVVAESDGALLGFSVVLRREAARDGSTHLRVIANTRARDFYRACGFVTVGEVQTRFRPAPRMRKPIDVAG